MTRSQTMFGFDFCVQPEPPVIPRAFFEGATTDAGQPHIAHLRMIFKSFHCVRAFI